MFNFSFESKIFFNFKIFVTQLGYLQFQLLISYRQFWSVLSIADYFALECCILMDQLILMIPWWAESLLSLVQWVIDYLLHLDTSLLRKILLKLHFFEVFLHIFEIV